MPVSQSRYRKLIAYFSDPLQETIACFSDPFTLISSALSDILKLKVALNVFFALCTVLIKVISLIYEKNYFVGRIPLTVTQ